MGTLLDIRNIEVLRGRTGVLDGFTLRIDEGCNTAILGPNGAGKSTLLKLVSGELHPVFSGDSHIKVFGKDRSNLWDLRSHLGIVSPDTQREYLAGVTCGNVVLSGFYSSVDVWQHQTFNPEQRAKAEEIIEMLGVGSLRERAYGSMSTGEQRRVLLARTLANDPRVLLLDEPTSGLDVRAAFLYSEVLRDLMRRGRTILLTTHHIHEIPPEIRRVVLLKNGRVFADGSREEVLTSDVLSALFEYPLHALSVNGTCQVFPARKETT
jgi:iron complex transport system ATP-binding protein